MATAVVSEQPKELVRVEANIEELPIFSARKGTRAGEVVEWQREGRDPTTGRPILQRMTLRPAVGIGLPATPERDLYYLVVAPWLEENGFREGGLIGPISYREACDRLGKKRGGRTYRQLQDTIETLTSMTVKFEHCIIDGKTRKLASIVDHWFSALFYSESEADDDSVDYRLKRGEFMLRAAPWFVKNYEANYLKPINASIYSELRGDIAKALYSYLDKRAYDSRRKRYRDEVSEDLHILRDRFRLAVKDTSKLTQLFRSASEELVDKWPALQGASIEKVRPGRYCAVYRFSLQQALAFDATPKKDSNTLVDELKRRGMTLSTAQRLVASHTAEKIRTHLDIHDQEAKFQEIKNPGGRLHRRIAEDWEPFDGYVSAEDRKKAEAYRQKKEAAKRAEQEEWDREQAKFDALPLEDKVQKRLDTWLMIQRSFPQPGREPEAAEVEAKRSALRQELGGGEETA